MRVENGRHRGIRALIVVPEKKTSTVKTLVKLEEYNNLKMAIERLEEKRM